MIALTALLRYSLIDEQGCDLKLDDFAIGHLADDYPLVTAILIHEAGQPQRRIEWGDFISVDEANRQIKMGNLDSGEVVSSQWLSKAVLLKGHVLDALALDLLGRAPILINDLWLEVENESLRLKSVDISFLAVIRRISRGRLASQARRSLKDWKYIEYLRGTPDKANKGLDYHGLIERLPAGEIAYLADMLPYPYAAELVALLPDRLAADALEVMMPDLQQQVCEELEEEQLGRIFSLMRPDILTDLLVRLGEEQSQKWLERLPNPQAERVLQLLSYPGSTAGGIMTNDIMTLPSYTTVKDTLSILADKLKMPAYINFIQVIYVIDDEENCRLMGSLAIKKLLSADHEKELEEIMDPYSITIDPYDKAIDSARRVVEAALDALPVVQSDGRLLGVITADTAIAVTAPKKRMRVVLRLFT